MSSKGDDPEDFNNYMTQGVKIPKDAEVCLVSSHINRRLMEDNEIQISAGANTFSMSYGSADFANSRDGSGYTPHGPTMLSLSLKSKQFPIKIKTFAQIEDVMNKFMNNSKNIKHSKPETRWRLAPTVPPGSDPANSKTSKPKTTDFRAPPRG